jgi:hypothetical protein
MPSKGYKRKRNNIITEELYKSFKEENAIEIDYETFRNIILKSNGIIVDIIANEALGFKLPESMGYIVVTKYKSNKKAIDWKNTKKYGKVIYHTNLHSFGYTSHIKWCKFSLARFKFNQIYKFEFARDFTRRVSSNTKKGMTYFTWNNSDFWNTSKLERFYNRTYKNNEE